MKLTIGGARGSFPVCGPDYNEFGGDTTAFLIESGAGEAVFIDAGTGLRNLAGAFDSREHAALLLTHYHLDHLAGWLAFPPLFMEGKSLEVVAPRLAGKSAGEVLELLSAEPLWPVSPEALKMEINYREIDHLTCRAPYALPGLNVYWRPLHHASGCVAWRISETSTEHSVLVATDVEWKESSPEEKQALLELGEIGGPPDLLIFDGHFAEEDYAAGRGWGHSTWRDAVEVAERIGARQLRLTHHNPLSDDKALCRLEKRLKKTVPGAALLRQGERIEV